MAHSLDLQVLWVATSPSVLGRAADSLIQLIQLRQWAHAHVRDIVSKLLHFLHVDMRE